MKRKNLDEGELAKKKVLKKPNDKPVEKSEYEKICDQNVKERKEEWAKMAL